MFILHFLRTMCVQILTQIHPCRGAQISLQALIQVTRWNRKKSFNEEEDIQQRILRKMDMISDAVDRQERLLKQLESEIKKDQKNGRVIDLTPWVVSIPVAFLLVAVYNYM
ncbi:hypothetical protein BS78_05G238100 [Paspalum vaginatum]|nr:hypothetical protein BS78_05G238100 [Paspalum vaginatum]